MITIVATCYTDDYWERFSERWLASIAALDPAPAGVVLVTDVLRPLPGIDNIVIGRRHMSDYWNVGVKYAASEWVALSGFDDVWLPDAMEPFTTDADVYGYPAIFGDQMSGPAAYLGGYEDICRTESNPMLGGYFFRRDLLARYPLRRMGYADWAQFCELSHDGVRIEFSDRPRHYWMRHEAAASFRPDYAHLREIAEFKAALLAGHVTKEPA